MSEEVEQLGLFHVEQARVPEPHPHQHPEQYRPQPQPWRDRVNTCAGCYAPIRWATTHNGKKMIFNPEPVAGAHWRLEGPLCFYVKVSDERLEQYEPHWATCPAKRRFKA